MAVRKKLISRPVKFSFIPEKTRHKPVLISVFLEKSRKARNFVKICLHNTVFDL